MSTFFEKNIDQNKKNWYLFDAKDQVLGRLATDIARVISGKHKANYTPHVDTGDFVVVINADQIKLTGKKWTDKIYITHTGFVGGCRYQSAQDLQKKHPGEIISEAVRGMLPKGILGRQQNTKLKVYSGTEHPHGAQSPKTWSKPKRTIRLAKSTPKK